MAELSVLGSEFEPVEEITCTVTEAAELDNSVSDDPKTVKYLDVTFRTRSFTASMATDPIDLVATLISLEPQVMRLALIAELPLNKKNEELIYRRLAYADTAPERTSYHFHLRIRSNATGEVIYGNIARFWNFSRDFIGTSNARTLGAPYEMFPATRSDEPLLEPLRIRGEGINQMIIRSLVESRRPPAPPKKVTPSESSNHKKPHALVKAFSSLKHYFGLK